MTTLFLVILPQAISKVYTLRQPIKTISETLHDHDHSSLPSPHHVAHSPSTSSRLQLPKNIINSTKMLNAEPSQQDKDKAPPRTRQRASLSCRECRRRKQKVSAAEPSHFPSSHGKEASKFRHRKGLMIKM